MLTAHDRIALARQFPTAELIEPFEGRLELRFPSGNYVFAFEIGGNWLCSVRCASVRGSDVDEILAGLGELREMLKCT